MWLFEKKINDNIKPMNLIDKCEARFFLQNKFSKNCQIKTK